MKKIVLYESADGQQFENLDECERHEKVYLLEKSLTKCKLSKSDFDVICRMLGINVDYFLDYETDITRYINVIEKHLHRLSDCPMNQGDYKSAIKALCVCYELYHSVDHDC